MDLSAYKQASSRPNKTRQHPPNRALNDDLLMKPALSQGRVTKPKRPHQNQDWSQVMLERVTMRRKQAADLMEGVLEERFKPVFALTRWPENQDNDLSLDVAYHILWHHESDEDNQQQEVFYMDAQLELMTQVIRHMSQGKALPPHFLAAYSPDMTTSLFKERTFLQELGIMMRQALRYFTEAWKQV